ncbi:MAG: oxidoreductase [Chloroflexi bacterium HGW-Chloroflexi-1]|nr:MAG: oxidoreductase [Chloroflexi bacterium HGW-Chloroflexi-1]
MTQKIYGIGLIGAGNIARTHAAAIAEIPNARVVGVYDSSEAAGRACAEELGGVAWTGDLDELLDRDAVDIVNICTPSGTHAELAVAAAQAGKHLIVEKPLDVTLERADRIIAAAKENNVKLTGIFPYRFRVGAKKAKEAIQQGRLGRLVLADVYVKWYRSQEYYHGWHGSWALDGGGALINQSIHNIDLLQWLAGPVDTIVGHVATLGHVMETEDTASAVLTFKNGALGVIQGATSCWPGDPARAEFHGARGTIVLEEGRIVVWKLADGTPQEEQEMTSLEVQDGRAFADPTAIAHVPHRRQIEDMLDAIEQDREPRVTGLEARKAIEIIRAIYLSAQRGERMRLPLTAREA